MRKDENASGEAGIIVASPCEIRQPVGSNAIHIQVVRVKKLTGANIVEVAARHNLRELIKANGAAPDSHIDHTRTNSNIVLRGPAVATEVAKLAHTLMEDAGVPSLRKDAVRALEIVFSLPAISTIQRGIFFQSAIEWAEEYYQAPIISAVIHNDEATPHCHVLLLPLVDGRMKGSDLMGNKSKLLALQTDFHDKVGSRHGLVRQAPQKRLGAAIRKSAASAAISAIKSNVSLLFKSNVVQALHDVIAYNPEPLMNALNLDMSKPKTKGTFAGIMTKPTKKEPKIKPIGFAHTKAIGFKDDISSQVDQTLSCVGFTQSKPEFKQPIARESAPAKQLHSVEHVPTKRLTQCEGFVQRIVKLPRERQIAKSVRSAFVK